ncbi:MAG: flagellar motor stator protein MotA [Pseudomonadota bacterium]|nr:flagellar motor stator protein MotA [Alphaproteobacteria bacterium]
MRFWIGTGLVITSVLLGYLIGGGHLIALAQPSEIIIIVGVGIGSFIIANSSKTLSRLKGALKIARKGPTYTEEDYLESLLLQFTLFKEARNKGMLSLEHHIDNPHESIIFQSYPIFMQHPDALNFLCDYLRIMSMGCEDPFLIEGLMDQELTILEEDNDHVVSAIQTLADAAPALGIVAAVLGVIHTMGAIDQPPAALVRLIAGALVGTFLGVLIAYGFLAPIAQSLKEAYAAKRGFLVVIRTGILAYLNDQAPIVAIEFARKNIDPLLRPSFDELEQATRELKQ